MLGHQSHAARDETGQDARDAMPMMPCKPQGRRSDLQEHPGVRSLLPRAAMPRRFRPRPNGPLTGATCRHGAMQEGQGDPVGSSRLAEGLLGLTLGRAHFNRILTGF